MTQHGRLVPVEFNPMNITRLLSTITLSTVLGWAALQPLSVAAQTPEEAVSQGFDIIKNEGFAKVAVLMHPDELAKFRAMLGPVVEASLAAEGSKNAAVFKVFADPSDAKKIAQLTDVAFMETFLDWVQKLQPGMQEMMQGATVATLGHIQEGDTKHVVVRLTMKSMGMEVEKLSVMSVRDYEGKPMLTLMGEMKGIAEAMKQKMK
jgi:hypothetical protein